MISSLKQLFYSIALFPSVCITGDHWHGQAHILESPGFSFCMNACKSKGAMKCQITDKSYWDMELGLWKGSKGGFSLALKKIHHPTSYIQWKTSLLTNLYFLPETKKWNSFTFNISKWHETFLARFHEYFRIMAEHFTSRPWILKQICTWRSCDKSLNIYRIIFKKYFS